MSDLNVTLGHHLDQVPIRQPIGDVLTLAQLDDARIEDALSNVEDRA